MHSAFGVDYQWRQEHDTWRDGKETCTLGMEKDIRGPMWPTLEV